MLSHKQAIRKEAAENSKRERMSESKEIRIAVPWGHIAGKSYGSPVDFPVLLVHGMQDNAGSFHRLISHLPAGHYYVAIDLPGHGWSSRLPTGVLLNFFDYVLSLRYVTEALGWAKFHLIGQSFGAQLCLFYSLTWPGRVERLVAIEGFYPRILPEDKLLPWLRRTVEAAAATAASEQQEEEARAYTRDEAMHALRCKRKFALSGAAAEAMFERSVSELAEGTYRFNRDPRLKNYVLPLLTLDQLMCLIGNVDAKTLGLFTHSSADIFPRALVRESQALVESLLDAKLVFIEGNHDVHNNHPERVAPYIVKFFTDGTRKCKL